MCKFLVSKVTTLVAVFSITIGILLVPNCTKREEGKAPGFDSTTAQTVRKVRWEELISHLPAKVLPSKAPIRIRFLDKQAGEHQVGVKMRKQPLAFVPDIEGDLVWEDGRTGLYLPRGIKGERQKPVL